MDTKVHVVAAGAAAQQTETKCQVVYTVADLCRDFGSKTTSTEAEEDSEDQPTLDHEVSAPKGCVGASISQMSMWSHNTWIAKLPILGPALVKRLFDWKGYGAGPAAELLQLLESNGVALALLDNKSIDVANHLAQHPTQSIFILSSGLVYDVSVYENANRPKDTPVTETLFVFQVYETRYGHPDEAKIVARYRFGAAVPANHQKTSK